MYGFAGLSASERGVVEKGFRAGHISILAATSTLAAGVNLPAGCVLVRSLSIGREFLNVMQYKQMCGRAGRMGQGGNLGESYLLVKTSEKQRALQLSNQAMPDVLSQMHPSADGGNALSKALLEVVGLGLCKSQAQVEAFVQQTLLFRQSMRAQAPITEPPVLAVAQSILNFLLSARILDTTYENKRVAEGSTDAPTAQGLKVTRLGRAIMQSNVNPDDAIVMYESLLRAQDGIHLETPLHLLYLVTPLEHSVSPDFKKLLGMYEGSRRSKNTVLADIFDAVGVDYALLNRWQVTPPSSSMLSMCTSAVKLHSIYATGGSTRGQNINNYKNVRKEEWRALTVCKRLWAAMALQGLLDGRSSAQVGKEFGVDGAEVDALRQGAQIMASKVVRFCEQVGWTAMERMLKDFQVSLQLGRDDPLQLTELLAVPQMPRKIAKVLAENPNTNSVGNFVCAPAGTVVQLLQLSVGFELQVG
jgi:replicative superfamily II helicase